MKKEKRFVLSLTRDEAKFLDELMDTELETCTGEIRSTDIEDIDRVLESMKMTGLILHKLSKTRWWSGQQEKKSGK